MSLICNLTGSDYNCSALFEGVSEVVTAIQACFAAIIFFVSVPINLLLIVAMIKYRHLLDKAHVPSIFILASNTVVSVFLNVQVLITAASRAWLFGNWGCQFFSLLTTGGFFSRCFTVGLLSVDRFCRVFFPFSYSRLAGKILAGILITSWTLSFMLSLVLFFCNVTGFNIAQPGCTIVIISGELQQRNNSIVTATVLCVLFTATLLPSLLYTVMYCKARSLRRVQPVRVTPHPDHPGVLVSQQRTGRAVVTYSLMLVNFFVVTVLIVLQIGIVDIFKRLEASSAAYVTVAFQISTLYRCYPFADLVIILTAREERKVLRMLIFKIFPCSKSAVRSSFVYD